VVLAVVLIGVVPLIFLGLRVASRHPAVKRAVLSRIAPEIRGQMSVGELDIGLASLSFGDVLIELGGGGFAYVPSAAVNLSYRKLLTTGLRAERSLGNVIVSGPRVTLVYGAEPDTTAAAFDLATLVSVLPDYLGVSDATLTLEDASTGRRIDVTGVDLRLERREDGSIEGDAVGGCLGGDANLRADLLWDTASSTLSVSGELSDASLARALPFPPGLPVEPIKGRVWATFAGAYPSGRPGSIAVDFGFEDVGAEFPGVGERLDRVAGEGRFDGDVVAFSRLAGAWRTSEWSAAGAFCLSACDLEGVTVQAREVPLEPLVALVGGTPYELAGTVDLEIGVRGPLETSAVEVTASRGAASVAGVPVTSLRVDGVLTDEAIEIAVLRAEALGASIAATGRLVRGAAGEPWELDLAADVTGLDLEAVSSRLGLGVAEGRLDLRGVEVRGTTERLFLESIIAWQEATFAGLDLGTGAGGMLLSDGNLSATFSRADAGYAISGLVTDLFGDPAIDAEFELSQLAVSSLIGDATGAAVRLTLDGAVRVEGRPEDLDVAGSLTAEADGTLATLAVGGKLVGDAAGRTLTLSIDAPDATVRGVDLPFEGLLSLDASEVEFVSSDVAGVGELEIHIGLDDERPLSAGLVVSGARLPDIAGLVSGAPSPDGLAGLVFASVSVRGTLARPDASVQLHAGNVEIAGIGGLDATLVAHVEGRDVRLDEFVVRHHGRDVLSAEGSGSIDGALAVQIAGRGIPGPLLGGGPESRFDVKAGLGGLTRRPTFDCRVESSEGEFMGIPFDRFSARLTGAAGVLDLNPLAIERVQSYRLTATGRLPYALIAGREEPGEGSLTIEVDGDPLALLAELTGLVDSATGQGRMVAHLVVDGRDVSVVRGQLDATATSVRPAGIFEEITDLTARASVTDGALITGEIEGLVDGRRVSIASRRNRTAGDRELAPLHLYGLDLGVLGLSTDPLGVEANVPGLMLEGDVGRVAARGRDGAPEFLIGGPLERPFLWGELEYSDLSFTYPWSSSGDGDGGGHLLSRAEWSISMVAGRNLLYRRPDANLKIERGGALDFVGTPADGGLCVAGRLESSTGTVTYASNDFGVKLASVDFPPFCEPPRFYVEAETRVDDGTTVSLTIDSIEAALTLDAPGATLDETALVLASDSPDDNTRERILSKLQYGMSYELLEEEEQAALERRRAIGVLGSGLSGYVMRPLLAPVEARIRRSLRLDLVRLEVDFLQHFLAQIDRWNAQASTSSYEPFLSNSRVTFGKYVSRDWLLSYVGFAESFEEDLGDQRLGLRSELGIEYEVSRNTSLSLRMVYDPSFSGWDRKIAIENRYEF